MGLFDNFPYTNFHELNLDWVLKVLKDIETTIDQFVSLNIIKYADPIQWDIIRQYPKNTIVIDPISGTAYISVDNVPQGVALSNTDYWSVVFDLGRFITLASQNFAVSYEPVLTTTATMPTLEGGWVVWNSILYEALNDIHVGDAYVIDGNIKKTPVEEFFNKLKTDIATNANNITQEILDRQAADNALGGRIDQEILDRQAADNALGGRIDQEILDRQAADTALGGRIDQEILDRQAADINIQNKIGDLQNLNTTFKSNLVGAINELYNTTRIYASKIAFINDTNNHNIDDIVYVIESGCFYKLVNSQSPITLTLLSGKYGELLPDNKGFYRVKGATTENTPEIYPIIDYLFDNGKYRIYLDEGNYTLEETLVINNANTQQIKIHGSGQFKTNILCTEGFINITVDGEKFRGSEFKDFAISGIATGIVGGTHEGIKITTKNNSAADICDELLFENLLLKYFSNSFDLRCRFINNRFMNVMSLYNNYSLVYNKTTADGFFNANTFINCTFASNKYIGVFIVGRAAQAVSNTFIGCDIEANRYSNDGGGGDKVEMYLEHVGARFIDCHFERHNNIGNFCAVCAVSSNITFDGAMFMSYSDHTYINLTSMLVFNQCSLYDGTTFDNFGTDTGTTVKNDTFTF